MDLLQVGPVNMGIDLSGGNIRMAQHGLNRAQVGPALQEMCGKRVTQGMWSFFSFDPSGKSVATNQLPKALAGQGLARTGQKQNGTGSSPEQLGPHLPQVHSNPLFSPSSEGQDPNFSSLPTDGQVVPFEIDLLRVQGHKL